jgi:hypothetical protein
MSTLRDFPIDLFVPHCGAISARIFANPHLEIEPTLFHDIRIDLQPFQLEIGAESELVKTSMRLEFIEFNRLTFWKSIFSGRKKFSGYKSLEGKTFKFPRNPVPGYIDASVYLGHVHNPIDVDKVQFGLLSKDMLPAKFDLHIGFEYESSGFKNVSFECSMNLQCKGLSIPRKLLPNESCNEAGAKTFANDFVEIECFGEPSSSEHSFSMEPRL